MIVKLKLLSRYLKLLATTLPIVIGGTSCVDGSTRTHLDSRPRNMPSRRIETTHWTTRSIVQGTLDGSDVVLDPFRMIASSAGLYMIDFPSKEIVHLSHQGEVVWRFGRKGAGPNEFSDPRDIKLDNRGRLWVLDPGNSRLTVLSANGAAGEGISLQSVGGTPHELIPLSSGEAFLIVDNPSAPFVRVARDGSVVTRTGFPWEGFSDLDYLATQLITTNEPTTGEWIAAFRVGDGFFPYQDLEWKQYRGWFVEAVPFPQVQVMKSGNETSVSHTKRPISAAISVTVSPTRVYFLFGGTSENRKRLVDSYSLDDGTYQGSYLLPRKVDEIAWHDGGLYSLSSDPAPAIDYLTLNSRRLP